MPAPSDPGDNNPSTDVVKLIELSKQAEQFARKVADNAVLRQVETDLTSYTFLFTDGAATLEIDVFVPTLQASSDQWTVQLNSATPLLGQPQPDIGLASLRVGPQWVAQAITTHWPGCKLRFLTLYREGGTLTWIAFCDTAAGVVTGSMDNKTGVFQPSDAPPAVMPVTATPQP